MKVYVFHERGALAKVDMGEAQIVSLLEDLAADTDTADLVVAVYLTRRNTAWEAHSLEEPVGPREFTHLRGDWGFVPRFGTPADLPERYRLVRISLGVRRRYPSREIDIYGWEMRFETFRDHLAYTFTHELHHYRRDRLGMHPKEGEHSTIRWAARRTREAGFGVSAERLPVRRRRRKKEKEVVLPSETRPRTLRAIKLSALHLSVEDLRELHRWIRRRLSAVYRQNRNLRLRRHYEMLRDLPDGSPLVIRQDDEKPGYAGQLAVKLANLRRNSDRMHVRTPDGREWRWPMEWLEPLDTVSDPDTLQPPPFENGK